MRIFASQSILKATAGALAALILVFAFVFSFLETPTRQAVQAESEGIVEVIGKPAFSAENVSSDVLWLARVIYSETKRPYEQELVAWVVRNRVETAYRGKSTYRGVVLDPWQFSAFNSNSPKRRYYSNLNTSSNASGWQTAMRIAHEVVHAHEVERPFDQATRHFYSEVSMVGRKHPAWATGKRPVALDRKVDPRRFRFFANIS
jgi:hypothetical protein